MCTYLGRYFKALKKDTKRNKRVRPGSCQASRRTRLQDQEPYAEKDQRGRLIDPLDINPCLRQGHS